MKYWKTQSGEILAVKDMTTQHIQNCIRMYERILADKPTDIYEDPDSESAFWAQRSENQINDDIEQEILSNIRSFKRILKQRKV